MTEVVLDYQPHEKQRLMHSTAVKQIMYGGAAGGGKSHGMRWDAVFACLENPGLDAYLFRRSLVNLEHTHIKRIRQELPGEIGRYNGSKNRFEFINGSFLNFCYAEHEDDVLLYDSVEFHWLGIDQAEQFTPYQLDYLRTRVRLGGFTPQDAWKKALPRVIFSANPGGACHTYLKECFIDPCPEGGKLFHDANMRDERNPDDKGWPSIFIPAKMEDNPSLESDYAAAFGRLPEYRKKQLRDGDWNVVPGAFFDCWHTPLHVIRPIRLPDHWTRFRAIDWGFRTPFSVGWWAVASEDMPLPPETIAPGQLTRFIPQGALIRYKEWYGCQRDPRGRDIVTKGVKRSAESVAHQVISLTEENVSFTVIDPSAFNRVGSGPSPAERMVTSGLSVRRADNNRELGWQEMYARLSGNEHDQQDEGVEIFVPMLYVFSSCKHFIRSVPLQQADEKKHEDVAKNADDHVADEARYACMSRPMLGRKPADVEDAFRMPTFNELRSRVGETVRDVGAW